MTAPFSAARLFGRVMAPFAAGYFLSYLYRTVNAVLGPHIVADITLDAGELGLMTGIYMLTFGAAQLPLGVLLDRFGPRRVDAALLLVAALGAVLFSTASAPGQLIAGRGLIGLGVSACLMAAIKANVQFFAPTRLALVNGITMFSGGLGAVAATAPVQLALTFTDWRGIFVILAVLTLGVALVLARVVPDKAAGAVDEPLSRQLSQVWAIVTDSNFRRVAPATAFALGSFMAVQGLWAGPWLRDVAGLDPTRVAELLLVMAAGMASGYLGWGVAGDRLVARGVPLARVAWCGMAAYAVLLAVLASGWVVVLPLLCFGFGFCGASTSLGYALMAQGFPAHLSGRAITSLNLVIFVLAFILQWGLGAVIGLWTAQDGGGWPVVAFQVALAVPAALLAACLVWLAPWALRRA